MIRLALKRADGSVDHVEVEDVMPIADNTGGLYVGENAIESLYPEWNGTYELDDEGNPSVLVVGEGETVGLLDDDGYLVWAVKTLPGFVSVEQVDA